MSQQPPLSADQVRAWSDFAGSSPLYRELTEVVASDEELLRVLNAVEHPPRPNVLFAGVQYILFREGESDLADFYPSFRSKPRPRSEIARPFREFVLAHEAELIEIGRTRFTQTNEPRRCTALLPGVWSTPLHRFHLVDFGTSAGLNLFLDRYRYRWGEISWGPSSKVHLDTEMRGEQVVPRDIEVLSRNGLDLNPIDPRAIDDRRWLEALVWPEHFDRLRRLRAALDLAADQQANLVAGDALETLGPTIDRLPPGEPVIVINSFVLNQFAPGDRGRLDSILDSRRKTRPVYRVSLEWIDSSEPGARLELSGDGEPALLGLAQPHGEWLELYARP